ncbi:2'-deoxynucleoside 5'-phosphate N-hydrolase 1 [Xenopus laevis]|uniref:2'-deoxynucleoside 5'-phosphate N-hydrolase 1 n=1 Tax=Xenopus laevis TaxID=8355 RepID=A0A8J0VFD4_XENLA|nr:2'-deoxynucleoside 5'-phosphate N-hydrolase 1 [Xenopus laevis]
MAALRVYFCGSIRGGREDQALYERIVRELRRYGTVLTEHVARPEIGVRGEDAEALGDKFIHDRDMDWLNQADVVVAEVTQPSLGVGYEIGRAVDMNKRILCLFRPSSGRALSAMIRGAHNGKNVLVTNYDPAELARILDQYFAAMFPELELRK